MQTISNNVRKMLRSKNSNKNKMSRNKYLSFTAKDLKQHIENQFASWMHWENYGIYDPKTWRDNEQTTWKWNLDHIIPQSDLPYSSINDENFKKCWALENLRPYSAKQNIIDGVLKIRHKNKHYK